MNTPVEDLRTRLERYSGFLAQDPENTSLINEVANVQLRLGHFDRAREMLKSALARHPADPALLSTRASVAMASGEAAEAVEILRGLIKSGHDHPVNRYNLAFALLYARQADEARTVLQPVVDDPQIPDAPVLYARLLHHLGELDEAIECLTAFVEKHPEHGEAQGVLSLLHLDAMHIEKARAAAEKAIAANPGDLSALVTLGSLALEAQDEKTSTDYFQNAIDRHPQSGRAWSGLGLATMLKLDLGKSVEQLQQAVKFMPNHIGTWHALAWCQLVANDIEGAKQSFERSMEIDRSFGETHGGLAVIAVMQQRNTDAEQSIKRALRLNPHSYAARFAQSLLVQKADPERAKQMIQKMFAEPLAGTNETLEQALKKALQRMPRQTSSKPQNKH